MSRPSGSDHWGSDHQGSDHLGSDHLGSDPVGSQTRWIATLAAIVLAGAALRLFHLGKESLWLDEAFSVSIARTTIAHIIEETSLDFHPPLYYVVLYYWVHWFDSLDATVRLLSVVFSLGTIVATWAVGRRLFGINSALIAVALVACSRFQIEFAQEARMYALLGLLGVVATYCLMRWCALDTETPTLTIHTRLACGVRVRDGAHDLHPRLQRVHDCGARHDGGGGKPGGVGGPAAGSSSSGSSRSCWSSPRFSRGCRSSPGSSTRSSEVSGSARRTRP